MNKKLLVLGIILTVAEAALIFNMFYPAMSANYHKPPKKPVPGYGLVKNADVGIYADQSCTTPAQSINWGLLESGLSVNKTTYIRNEGNQPIALIMSLSNWNPANSYHYIGLSWDYTGQTLDVDQVTQVRFTLHISENIQGITDFSFDITIASN